MRNLSAASMLIGLLSLLPSLTAHATPGGGDANRQCHYSVRLKELKVNDNKSGISDSTLELSVRQQVSADGVQKEGEHTVPDKMREGETRQLHGPNSPYFKHVTQEGSSVSLSFKTTVIERDKGANGKDDTGQASSSASFTCSGRSSKTHDAVVMVKQGGNGKDVAKITVTAEISWGE